MRILFTVKQEQNTYQKMYFICDVLCESDNGYKHAFVPAAWTASAHSPSARHWIYQEQQRQLMCQCIVSHLHKVNIDLSTAFLVLVKSIKTSKYEHWCKPSHAHQDAN